jgi:integration host factor subunit alpha
MVIDEMTSALETEGTLNLRSFGVFSVRKKHARQGRNPRTGVAATITARKVVSFKASPAMLTAINNEDKSS